MTSGGNLQPNRAKDTKYDIDMKSPATSRYIGQTGGHQARRPKVYLGLDRDPVLVGIVRPPHSARRLCQRIPQIIAPPPHLQRSPGRPVFQYLVSCQPNLCQEPRQPVFSVLGSIVALEAFVSYTAPAQTRRIAWQEILFNIPLMFYLPFHSMAGWTRFHISRIHKHGHN